MKSIKIKGKDYIPVHERIKYLKETCGLSDAMGYSLVSEYDYFPERKMWVVRALLTIKVGDEEYEYSGLAQEVESDDYGKVNFSSACENAQTSAWGRAFAAAGIGIDSGVSSADEMQKASNRTPKILTEKQFITMTVQFKAGEVDIFERAKNAGYELSASQEEIYQSLKPR